MRIQISSPGIASFRGGIFVGTLALAGALGSTLLAHEARACGGFFCGQQPVDQTAERILFEVGPDSVTMTSQISYSGDAADFAWVLPLGSVPDVSSLAVFPQKALNALDTNSGPIFNPPQDSACFIAVPQAGGVLTSAPSAKDSAPTVNVYVRAEVGPYDVAVVGSDDPSELVAWLRNAGYRITPAMEPYVAQYTTEGMKFLALKLKQSADTKDIQPFRFTLPGSAPSIPLRMTALAAEPEMSIVVFVLGDRRYEGKNWGNLTVADDQIRYNPFNSGYPVRTNWAQLVAKAVDTANGQGWVTEFAGTSATYVQQVGQQVTNGFFATPEDKDAAQQLLDVLEAHPYLTRLYTRLSAEEMASDPVFGASALGDVDRSHQLSRIVNGIDQCTPDARTSTDPCDFVTCGAAGLCRPVPATPNASTGTLAPVNGAPTTDTTQQLPGCACLPGATARVTKNPDGTPTVICQDGRLSFLNPGDREADSVDALPDPCATFSCGDHGQCVSMNLTPTCVCDQGFVAVGTTSSNGSSQMTCIEPPALVPLTFYQAALPTLPDNMPGGRDVAITTPEPMPEPGVTPDPTPTTTGFPMPRSNPALGTAPSIGKADSGCALGVPMKSAASWLWVALGLAGVVVRRRAPRWTLLGALGALALGFTAKDAEACGGLFCGFTQPVAQNAEHILFEVGADSVTMTAQITYTGDAADFAWILPLSAVPDVKALSVFPQQGLDLLDSLTAPTFTVPTACFPPLRGTFDIAPVAVSAGASSAVNVYVRAEVGPYDVAVVGSADPSQLVSWLRDAGYRITPAMEPYVAQYTAAGMSFLALKLQQSKGVKDIQPFRFTLPGTAPSIPLRMTAIAADPEMAIQVFVLGEQRYEGKNWDNLSIHDNEVHFDTSNRFGSVRTNWSALIARAVDAAGGQGWVTEFAGSATPFATLLSLQLRTNLQNAPYSNPDPDTTQAQQALLDVLSAHPYLTRLQTRLSAEEMTSDPIFGASALADVSRNHDLSRVVDGVDQCPSASSPSKDECDFTTCGAAGFCRSVSGSERSAGAPAVTGCACLPGATARVTTAPDGTATVVCQDARLSFLNPGDRGNDDAEVLADPCAEFSCGGHGQCVPVNLVPTCVCDQGYVAVGSFAGPPGSSPVLSCVTPRSWVPVSFYSAALPALPDDLPGGREVTLSDGSFPLPRFNAAAAATEGGCALAPLSHSGSRERSGGWEWLCTGAALALSRLRRRTAQKE